MVSHLHSMGRAKQHPKWKMLKPLIRRILKSRLSIICLFKFNNVRNLQQFLKLTTANATTGKIWRYDIKSGLDFVSLAFCDFRWRTGLRIIIKGGSNLTPSTAMKFRPKFFWKWSFFDQNQQPLKSVGAFKRILRALFISLCPKKFSSFLDLKNASNRFRLFSRDFRLFRLVGWFRFFFPGSACFSTLASHRNLPSWVKYYGRFESFGKEFRRTKFIAVERVHPPSRSNCTLFCLGGLFLSMSLSFCVRVVFRIFIEPKLSNLSALLVLSPVNM